MFYKYEIKNNGIEDILYLYLTMSYEFSKELSSDLKDNELTRRTKNFIKNNGINYAGNKVYLVIDGIVVKSLDVSKNENEIEVLKENLFYSNDHYLVNIKLDNGSMIETSLREYLLGVLATNINHSIELEAIKALVILYRTYAYKEMHEKNVISANNNFALFRDISYYKISFAEQYEDIINKFNIAINDTDCLFVTYEHHYILPFIHYCNYGMSLGNEKYPYLSNVSSLWDLACPNYINVVDYTYDNLSMILNTQVTINSNIEIVQIDENGLLEKLRINNSIFIGEDFVRLLKLNSRSINIILNNNNVRFITRGMGNFLGLSIFGANELAKNGCDFANIIKYYYPKTKINKYVKELS